MTNDLPDEWFRPPRPQTPAGPTGWQESRAAQPAATPQGSQWETGTSHSVGVDPAQAPAPEAPRAPHGRTHTVLPVLGGVAVLVGIGALAGQLLGGHDDSSTTDPSGSSQPLSAVSETPDASVGTATATATPTPSSTPGAAATPWAGPVQTVAARSVTATCTAASQPGYDGRPVPSVAERVLDGDMTTGWRCDGTGTGQSLHFTFPKGTRLVGIRMSNGYTKMVDATSLYPQYRRLSEVSWNFHGAYFAQTLTDGQTGLQEIRFPATSADQGLQMQILGSTAPGSTDATRNAVVVTEVQFLVAKA